MPVRGLCLFREVCLFGGCVPVRGVCAYSGGGSPGGVPGESPPRTATAAGGTHPTEMHSRFLFLFCETSLYSLKPVLCDWVKVHE